MLVVYREFGMTFIRMIAVQKGVAIGARKGGKFKTVLYVAAGFYSLSLEALTRLDMRDVINWTLAKDIGVAFYGVCVLMAYISFADYLIHFKTLLTSKIDGEA
jgi:CDP-diacylglycerol--glycerol-3-phosphate 3-phosphatidyltransferase